MLITTRARPGEEVPVAHHPDPRNKEGGSDVDPAAFRTPVAVPGKEKDDGGTEEGRLRRIRVRMRGRASLEYAGEAEAKNRSWVQVLGDSHCWDPWEDGHTVHWKYG